MLDDKTVIKPSILVKTSSDATVFMQREVLIVTVLDTLGKTLAKQIMTQSFTVGRASDNDIQIENDIVSRKHLAIKLEADGWWLHHLNSTNGVYLDGCLVADKVKLALPVSIGLGKMGLILKLQIQKPAHQTLPAIPVISNSNTDQVANPTRTLNSTTSNPKSSRSQADIEARLLAHHDTDDMGDYTLMVRRVIRQERVVTGKRYHKVIWVLAGLFVLFVGLAAYQQIALTNTRQLAIEMFYDIKALEVSLSQADIKLDENASVLDRSIQAISKAHLRVAQEELRAQQEKLAIEKRRMIQERQRLVGMKAKYRQYVEEAVSLRLRFPTPEHYEEDLITKVAHELGESELELPEGFVKEVRKYIGYWQASSRMKMAIGNLEQNNYLPFMIEMLHKQGLPLYFIYLPLQESNYDLQAIGPETRYGIAKGAWQLLSSTAQQYGLSTGPLSTVREYDPQDQRFDFKEATTAGIKYIKQIYSTEAQASGLLVMASYNYGDNRVKNMISKMPENPRDRNFWQFLQHYELPQETRDYVFYIFSAAVIGEDPKHFGFDFNPPLFKANVPEG